MEKKQQFKRSLTGNTMSQSETVINKALQKQENKENIPEERRPHMQAPRAGTRGFRAPEVLLKHPHQTVDILFIKENRCYYS